MMKPTAHLRTVVSFLVGAMILVRVASVHAAVQTTAGNETINASGIAEGVVFGGNHTLTVSASTNVGATSGLSFNTNNVVRGTVTFEGSSTLSGAIGQNSAANVVNTVNVDGANGTTVTIGGTGTIEALAIDFGGDGTLVIGDGGAIDNGNSLAGGSAVNADTAGQGELQFAGSADVYGAIGTTRGLRLITIKAEQVVIQEGNSVVATTVNFAADGGELRLAATNSNVTANFTATTSGQGTLIHSNGDHTITGEIGTSSAAIKQVQVGTGTSAFSGNIYAGDLNFNADGTATIAASNVVSGTITTDTDGTGTVTYAGSTTVGAAIGTAVTAALKAINVNGGTFSSGFNISADTITISNDSTLMKMTAATTITAATDFTFENSTTAGLDLGSYLLTLTGKIDLNDSNALATTINSASDFGRITASGNSTSNAATTVSVTVNGYVANGSTYKIIDGAAGGTVAAPTTVTDDSVLTSFTGSGSAGDLTLTATTTALPTISTDTKGDRAGTALDADALSGTMNSTYLAIGRLGSATAVTEALKQLNPQSSDAPVRTTLQVASDIGRIVFERLASDGGLSGISSGDAFSAKSIWAKLVGGYADQNARKGEEGYSAIYGGATLGVDAEIDDADTLGLAFTYAQSGINYDTSVFGNTLIDGYQWTLYHEHDFSDRWRLYSLMAFGLNHYDGSRTANIGSDTYRATFDHWGQQYTAQTELGYDLSSGPVTVTPLASIGYTHLTLGGYREIGAGEISLQVDRQQYDTVESGLGLKLTHPAKAGSNQPSTDLHGMWYWDMVGDRTDISSNFSGGATSFKTLGVEPDRHRFVVGGLLNFSCGSHTDVSVGYDVEFKDRFISHNGMLKVRHQF
ncbi:MAG: autotransporter domain-containing protein [Candidatus Omnitrophica bacterium]|nr:autotransporter domain-containing protein [Candidatus Omnitrophota bacterium]